MVPPQKKEGRVLELLYYYETSSSLIYCLCKREYRLNCPAIFVSNCLDSQFSCLNYPNLLSCFNFVLLLYVMLGWLWINFSTVFLNYSYDFLQLVYSVLRSSAGPSMFGKHEWIFGWIFVDIFDKIHIQFIQFIEFPNGNYFFLFFDFLCIDERRLMTTQLSWSPQLNDGLAQLSPQPIWSLNLTSLRQRDKIFLTKSGLWRLIIAN